jgi:hypothetical protein
MTLEECLKNYRQNTDDPTDVLEELIRAEYYLRGFGSSEKSVDFDSAVFSISQARELLSLILKCIEEEN